MDTLTQKMNLEKDSQELKLYVFTVQNGPVQIELPEEVKAIMAYNDFEAVNMVRKDYPVGLIILVRKRAQVEIKKIISAINIGFPQTIQIKTESALPEKTAQNFIHGLMLVADKFVENKRDQASLKRIIGKIKV